MILLINYFPDMFRPQFLAVFREPVSVCSKYGNLFGSFTRRILKIYSTENCHAKCTVY
jgi:hypothetical protein